MKRPSKLIVVSSAFTLLIFLVALAYTTGLPKELKVGASPIASEEVVVQPQIDQHQIALELVNDDVRIRNRAIDSAKSIAPANTGVELRSALINLLSKENEIVKKSHRMGVTLDTLDDPDVITIIQRMVAEFNDPTAIGVLAEALGMGTVIRPLAGFGEQAVPAIVSVVSSSESHYSAVDDGLRTLRLIVEGTKRPPLSTNTLAQIRSVVRQRLDGRQPMFTTVWYAIDLATIVDDVGLREIVKNLAENRNAVLARGIDDPSIIEKTQKRATDRLAGIPAQPRP